MFELEGVSKRFGATQALHPLSLRIPTGRTTVLLGPSGCGKSTLLKLMNGLLLPDSGRVLFDGEPLSTQDVRAARRRMGYCLQGGGLFPHLSARDNVLLLPRHLGWDRARGEERLHALCALTRFPEEGLARFPNGLSGGQRQRVSLMRALALDPMVLLLDEPLGALDPLVRAELQQDLRALFAELRKTVVLVTHDLAEAAVLGEHVVLLREGRLVQEGTLGELARAPADPFVTRFLEAQARPRPEELP
ncbi:ATP-binding cassette domain-containing protein [Aggregicoccus sp. 17bor-14]|uniref:ATP-binding cassette domain-containing protein n=1 Tax=Myxococcaceae TaxID=31 RepID=UPI00129C977B|nr:MULTISPECIES: ATP-binding cassette domain-containing protein [Myxococcaceae]MBF5043435.1 ATP-binding cassette domain-containing protein [Simulacricoccus sp. 17bor-14]MRI89193.1 ATP-binding cassette domain-containing protein [Aggregicoccus sp. 17bor-14]